MNKTIPALTLICGFLLGVIAGPWLWPPGLLSQAPAVPSSSPQTALQPEASPAPEATVPTPVTASTQEEPELVLKGVLVGEDAARSRALIAHGDAEPRLYKVDDKLPDGSVLKTVYNKHVEIEKNGEPLNLTLDRGKPSATTDESARHTETEALQDTAPTELTDASAPSIAHPTHDGNEPASAAE